MTSWLEDITQALRNLGGIAALQDIYEEVARIRTTPLPTHWKANIRGIIEDNSKDSAKFKGKDVFYSVEGLGRGLWGLRDFISSSPKAADINNNLTEPETQRVKLETYRVLRDTQLARTIKALHQNVCQICGQKVSLANGETYAETHHIRPLGKPHNGPDIAGNILILCPNHHVMCDYGALKLKINELRPHPNHVIDTEFIRYHNDVIAKV